MKDLALKEVVEKKLKKLSDAKQILKDEFVGLNEIVDQIISKISTWYLFPHLQTRPLVINLWGMTGVGKSSLTKRLSELLDFDNKYFNYDVVSQGAIRNMSADLEEASSIHNSKPIIIALDEFQKSTIAKDSTHAGIMWKLLDNGKFKNDNKKNKLNNLNDIINELKEFLHDGADVEEGIVLNFPLPEKRKVNARILLRRLKSKGESQVVDELKDEAIYYFVSPDDYKLIKELSDLKFTSDLRDILQKMDGNETILFLESLLEEGINGSEVDFSKSLIFVLGNLDGAYSMSSKYSPDIEADEFHEQSLKINISDMKRNLRPLFRNEHISRLGNNHIIYPAFSKNSFDEIISMELNKIKNKLNTDLNIDVEIHKSINKIIYKEGVYPAQGVRPVFSTIQSILGSKLGFIYYGIAKCESDIDRILISNHIGKVVVVLYSKDMEVDTFSFKIDLQLEKIRSSVDKETKAITAIHESGHAVLSIVLKNTIPFSIVINSAGDEKGFVSTKSEVKYFSKRMMINQVATFLGGQIAEEIIFGEENITLGSASDLRNATSFISEMFKRQGFGKIKANIAVESSINPNALYDNNYKTNTLVEEYLEEASTLAYNTLIENKELILHIAKELISKGKLNNMQVKTIVDNVFYINSDEVEERAKEFSYTDMINNAFESCNMKEIIINDRKIQLAS